MASTLKLATYEPNFNDPRVKERARAVLAWCDALKLSKNGRPVHHDELFEVLGNPGRGLGRWLFVNLLTQTGSYQPGKWSFSYKLKQRGYEKVYGLLNAKPPTEVDVVVRVYGPLIRGEVAPKYKDEGNRRYHPIQNIKRDVRHKSFSGWWDYDIEASAPTLVHQFVTMSKWFNGKPFPALERLINEKHKVRAEVAALTELDLQPVKELLSAVFFRGNPAPSHKAGMFRILGGDFERHQRFVTAPFIKQLRSDARRLWLLADAYDKIGRAGAMLFDGAKPSRRPAKATRRRMAIYLSLERQVMQVIEDEVVKQKVPMILMHDGFMARDRLGVSELVSAVKDKTGYSIRLSEVRLGSDQGSDKEPDAVALMKGDPGDTE
jgi:hypothetical protein